MVIASATMLFGVFATVASAQLVTVDDDGGSNDPNGDGQNDLTQFGRDDSDPDTITIKWSWDEPSTIQGGNTSNACALFDSDGDGNVDNAFCLEVSSDGAGNYFITDNGIAGDSIADFPAWIECSDGKDDRCAQPNRLADPNAGDLMDSSCTIMVTATDPFAPTATTDGTPGGAGDDYPNDLMATCTIDRDLIGDGELINVCSYPSAGNDGNNNPFDCVVTPGSWFLIIVKSAPAGTTQQFDFTVSGTTSDDGIIPIIGSGQTNLLAATGLVSASEAVPAGWQLDSATCTNGDDPAAVQGDPGETVVCTFTNSLAQGTLTLQKFVTNDNGGTEAASSWTLTATDSNGAVVLSDAGMVSGQVDPGNYDLAEAGPTDYSASPWVCDGGQVDADTVSVAAGDDITCTITNDDIEPTLTLSKTVVNDDGGMRTAGEWTLDDGGFDGSVGTWTISEIGPTDYELISIACDNGQSNSGPTLDVTIGLADDVNCVFTNDDIAPKLTLTKTVVNDDGGMRTAGEWTLDDGGFDGSVGTWTISETGPTDYELISIVCDNGQSNSGPTLDVTVGLDDDVNCVFTNDDIAPTLTVIKVIINDDGGTITDPAFFTMNVDNGGTTTSFPGAGSPGTTVDVAVGAYDVTETNPLPDFYAVSYSADCTGTLALGDSKTCTVTNDDIAGNQPSIAITAPDISDGADASKFVGTTTFTNESDGLDPAVILVSSFDITVEVEEGRGKNRTWVPVDVMCTTDPAVPFTFGPDPFELEFSCMTADGSDLDGKYRITIEAQIFDRAFVFTERTIVRF